MKTQRQTNDVLNSDVGGVYKSSIIENLKLYPKTTLIFVMTCFSLALHLYSTRILNASYDLSKFPVPYYEAQLSFSADKIKEWYSYIIEEQTLGIYLKTQHIDFIFISSVLLLHFFALMLISRFYPQDNKGRKLLIVCALVSTIAPLADIVENLISYVMLASPNDFPDWLAFLYSFSAAIKFAMFTFAYITAAIGLLIGIFVYFKSVMTSE